MQNTGAVEVVSGQRLWAWRQDVVAALSQQPDLVREFDLLLRAYSDLDTLALRLATYRTDPAVPLRCRFTHLQQLWQQRVQARVPLQYLMGQTAWRDFQVQVTPGVLIPRPETELLIDLARIGLALAFSTANIHAVDVSGQALAVAQQNMTLMALEHRIQTYQGKWLEPLSTLRGQLTGIVSNPPYIPTAMVKDLQPEVAGHEPHLALDGGADGLECLRQIIAQAPAYLQAGGVLLVEMMQGQAASVADLLVATGLLTDIQIHPDLNGIERFAQARRM
jgi:release factor glutamine methyltransferase